MIRITDQYFWSVVFSAFFLLLIAMGTIILETEARIPLAELSLADYVLITLATWRLTRLFVYDELTRFLREQFYDLEKVGKKIELVKPKSGPRRMLASLMGCPWCMGVWLAAVVVFAYVITPYAYFAVIVLAVSAVATFLQIFTNLVGNHAERVKREIAD